MVKMLGKTSAATDEKFIRPSLFIMNEESMMKQLAIQVSAMRVTIVLSQKQV